MYNLCSNFNQIDNTNIVRPEFSLSEVKLMLIIQFKNNI